MVKKTTESPEPMIILACSALKKKYRDHLKLSNRRVLFVWPHGSKEVILDRMVNRPGHFMNPSLVDSQFAALEPPSPEDVDVLGPLDISLPLKEMGDQVMIWLMNFTLASISSS